MTPVQKQFNYSSEGILRASLQWYNLSDSEIYLTYLIVHGKKESGTGTACFRAFIQSLPTNVSTIKLNSAFGSWMFWLKMGFVMDRFIKDYSVESYLSQDAENMILNNSETLRLLKKDYLDGNLKASKNPIHTKLKMVFLYLKKI